MAGGLKRDLGLLPVTAISIGAMVGSGIFILPALAYRIAGPTVVLAFFIAGILVLPAALSKIEMATAMPEDGGTYLYIERGMGPLLGTIAGVGTWFSLSFKGALALVGGVPYLIYIAGGELPVSIRVIAIAIALVLIALNLVGSDVTGRFQVGIVVVMLLAMLVFVVRGIPAVDPVRVQGAFDPRGSGTLSLLEAAGAVYVSYAGVTKIASVAEEIEDPSRNIPLGMLGSLFFTGGLYVLIVWVLVGVLPVNEAGGSETSRFRARRTPSSRRRGDSSWERPASPSSRSRRCWRLSVPRTPVSSRRRGTPSRWRETTSHRRR